MATIVEDMNTGADAAAAVPQPSAPVVFDDASLDRLADLLRARIHPTRPAWQTTLLVTLAGALIAAATAGYLSLRGDIASVEENLRAELLDFRAEFHRVTLDHTERLTRVETVQAQHTEQLARNTEQLARNTEQIARVEAVQAQHTEQLARNTEQLARHTEQLARNTEQLARHTEGVTRLEAAHPHPPTP